jgi:hypothetical protein
MEKRIIDGYEELRAVRLGGTEQIVAARVDAGNSGKLYGYRLYERHWDNPLGMDEYRVISEDNDYLKIMREFAKQLSVRLDSLELDRVYRGSALIEAPLLEMDCVPGGLEEDLTGKLIAIKQEAIAPEYRACSHQLYIATGGFGCSPASRGRAVYCKNLYSGEEERWDRSDILGVVAETTLPEWAHEKLARLREPPEKESVMEKLHGAKAAARAPREQKPKGKTKSEPEL